MLKLIQFKDCKAIWSDDGVTITGFKCRNVAHLDMLPHPTMLEFNCTESELAVVSNQRNQLYVKAKEHYVPEVVLITK